jgi:two-component SAPR family response regulator
MGITYLETKQYPLAIEYFKKYLAFDTTNMSMVATIGKIYQAMGDTINARLYYERTRNKLIITMADK